MSAFVAFVALSLLPAVAVASPVAELKLMVVQQEEENGSVARQWGLPSPAPVAEEEELVVFVQDSSSGGWSIEQEWSALLHRCEPDPVAYARPLCARVEPVVDDCGTAVPWAALRRLCAAAPCARPVPACVWLRTSEGEPLDGPADVRLEQWASLLEHDLLLTTLTTSSSPPPCACMLFVLLFLGALVAGFLCGGAPRARPPAEVVVVEGVVPPTTFLQGATKGGTLSRKVEEEEEAA